MPERSEQKVFHVHLEGHLTVLMDREGYYEANISLEGDLRRGRGKTPYRAILDALTPDRNALPDILQEEFGDWVAYHPNASLFDWQVAADNILNRKD